MFSDKSVRVNGISPIRVNMLHILYIARLRCKTWNGQQLALFIWSCDVQKSSYKMSISFYSDIASSTESTIYCICTYTFVECIYTFLPLANLFMWLITVRSSLIVYVILFLYIVLLILLQLWPYWEWSLVLRVWCICGMHWMKYCHPSKYKLSESSCPCLDVLFIINSCCKTSDAIYVVRA